MKHYIVNNLVTNEDNLETDWQKMRENITSSAKINPKKNQYQSNRKYNSEKYGVK